MGAPPWQLLAGSCMLTAAQPTSTCAANMVFGGYLGLLKCRIPCAVFPELQDSGKRWLVQLQSVQL